MRLQMRNELIELEEKMSILEPSPEKRVRLMKFLDTYAGNFIDNLDSELTFKPDLTKDKNRLTINGAPTPLDSIYNIIKEEVDQPGLNPAHGGHLGYIPGGGIFATAMGDFIAAISNRYAGIYFGGPGAVRLENRVIDWMKGIIGYPDNAVGNLTSGGSIANLIAITAARDKYGIIGSMVEKAVIYLSEQTHHCVHKALRIAGLGTAVIREIPLDERFNIRIDALQELISEDISNGLNPFLVVASAGTTNTGNIDPLDDIAEIAKKHDMWFHIDGAYGGFFILVDELKSKFSGIEKADSVVMDPHKGLFLAYGLGAVLIKDREAVFKSHHYTASYLQDIKKNNLEYSSADLSPELTKHFRGMRLWLPLKLYGVQPFIYALKEKRMLCLYFLEKVKDLGFETGPEPDLSVGIFRYRSEDGNHNAANQKLIDLIHEDGRVFLSSTLINGEVWIRVAVLSFRTHLSTVDLCIDMIRDCLKKM